MIVHELKDVMLNLNDPAEMSANWEANVSTS